MWLTIIHRRGSMILTFIQWMKGKSPSHCPAIKVFGNSWIQEMLYRYRMNIFLEYTILLNIMDVEFYYFWAITNLNLEIYLNYRFSPFSLGYNDVQSLECWKCIQKDCHVEPSTNQRAEKVQCAPGQHCLVRQKSEFYTYIQLKIWKE